MPPEVPPEGRLRAVQRDIRVTELNFIGRGKVNQHLQVKRKNH
jgi:hypothetical protein